MERISFLNFEKTHFKTILASHPTSTTTSLGSTTAATSTRLNRRPSSWQLLSSNLILLDKPFHVSMNQTRKRSSLSNSPPKKVRKLKFKCFHNLIKMSILCSKYTFSNQLILQMDKKKIESVTIKI
jgi:hypothetical protein